MSDAKNQVRVPGTRGADSTPTEGDASATHRSGLATLTSCRSGCAMEPSIEGSGVRCRDPWSVTDGPL